MRFAYIDSQGKEVGIATLEGVQLRIELGAIEEDTLFFDAHDGRWAAAEEHEVFRKLQAEIEGREAPAPSPSSPPSSPDAPPSPSSSSETPASGTPKEAGPEPGSRPRAPDPFALEAGPLPPEESEKEDSEGEATGSGRPEATPEGEVQGAELDELGSLDILGDDAAVDPGSGGEAEADPEEEAFEIADMGTLDLAPELEEQVTEGRYDQSVGGAEGEETPGDETPSPAAEVEEPEGPDEEEAGGVDGPGADEATPEWMQWASAGRDEARESPEPPPSPGGEAEDGRRETPTPHAGPSGAPPDPGPEPERTREEGPGGAGHPASTGASTPSREEAGTMAGDPGPPPGGEAEQPRRPLRTRPRTDPSVHRKRRARRRRLTIAGGVLVVVAMGGWFGWQAFLAGGSSADGNGDEAGSQVVIPHLAPALVPVMSAAADSAWADAVDSLLALGADLPPEPNPDWLAGIYLANAGDYPDVATYWEEVGGYLERIRARDDTLFARMLEARIPSDSLGPRETEAVEARALAGFEASAPERRRLYDRMDDLITTAASLHDFLVVNQDQITYDAGTAGVSRDPVRQATPATPELGEELWDRVADIPRALDSLGTLDRVSTERLLEVFFARLEEAGVR